MGRSEDDTTSSEAPTTDVDERPLRKSADELAAQLEELRAASPPHIEVSLTPAGGILRTVRAPVAATESLLARVARQLRLPVDPTKEGD